jgi:hypothetical protein
MVFTVHVHEVCAVFLVLGIVAGRNETGGIRTQNLIERGNVVVPVCCDQCINSLLGALKCLLSGILRRRRRRDKERRSA